MFTQHRLMLSVIFVSSSSCSFDEQAKKFVAFLRSQRRKESDRRVKIDERNDVKSLEVGWLVTGSRPVKFHIWVIGGTEGRTPFLICIRRYICNGGAGYARIVHTFA